MTPVSERCEKEEGLDLLSYATVSNKIAISLGYLQEEKKVLGQFCIGDCCDSIEGCWYCAEGSTWICDVCKDGFELSLFGLECEPK